MLVGKQQLFSVFFCCWAEKDQLCEADAVDLCAQSSENNLWGWWSISSGYGSAGIACLEYLSFSMQIILAPSLFFPMEDKRFITNNMEQNQK